MKKENDGASKKFENKTAGGKRRAIKRAKKRKYGKGEAGKAKEAAEASIKFAEGNLDMMGASKKKPKGVKDADTEYMPVVDREKDAMKKGASMAMKKMDQVCQERSMTLNKLIIKTYLLLLDYII